MQELFVVTAEHIAGGELIRYAPAEREVAAQHARAASAIWPTAMVCTFPVKDVPRGTEITLKKDP